MPRISIVLATYNRPQALAVAIRSVLWQTVEDWELLVIGDACDAATGHLVETFNDPRIRYVNLAERYGEQSGPNSVGMAVARAPLIAFLNHDDVWLPDFLERGLGMLERTGADLYTGSAVFATSRGLRLKPYRLTAISPPRRTVAASYCLPSSAYFEPISGWMARTEAARRVGPVRPAITLYRSPLDDWMLRTARAGLGHINDDAIVVLKDNSRPRIHRKRRYAEPRMAMIPEMRRMARLGANGYRGWAEAEVRRNVDDAHAAPNVSHFEGAALTQADFAHYLETGEDRFDLQAAERGFERGWQLRRLSKVRTGSTLAAAPDLDDAISHAKNILDNEHA